MMFLKSVNETKARHKNSNYNSSNFVSSNNQLSINNSQKSSSGASRRTSIVRQTSKTTSEEIKRNVQKSRERSKNYERAVAARRRNSRAAWSVDHLRVQSAPVVLLFFIHEQVFSTSGGSFYQWGTFY